MFDSCIVFAAKLQGDNRPASHTQADKDGGKEDHEGIGRADCGKSLGSQEASDNQGICNVIALLEQIAEHERKGKAEHTSGDAAAGQGMRGWMKVHEGRLFCGKIMVNLLPFPGCDCTWMRPL